MRKLLPRAQIPAAVFGIAGSALLALSMPCSRYGWFCFLASNICWIGYAFHLRSRWLVVQNVAFCFTTILGIAKAFHG